MGNFSAWGKYTEITGATIPALSSTSKIFWEAIINDKEGITFLGFYSLLHSTIPTMLSATWIQQMTIGTSPSFYYPLARDDLGSTILAKSPTNGCFSPTYWTRRNVIKRHINRFFILDFLKKRVDKK